MLLTQLLDQVPFRCGIAGRPDVVNEDVGAFNGWAWLAVQDRARPMLRACALLDAETRLTQPV
ncbi:MAG TPA: hypothetical protein VIK08_01830 [Candidatus Limnocylindrales bacterium]